MRNLARIQRRDVAFEIRERRRGRVEHRAPLARLGWHGLEVGPVEDGRVHDRLAGGLRKRHHGDGSERGNGGNQ